MKYSGFLAVGLPLAACLFAAGVAAQAYPDRPIKLVVPYPPGGSTDPVARLLAADIATRLGQPVVVDNKPGAAGSIGTEFVAKAAPDGYTLLLHTSVIATDPTFKKTLPYNVRQDLAPVTLTVNGPSAGGQPDAAREERRGADRLREGQSGQAQLRLRGSGLVGSSDR